MSLIVDKERWSAVDPTANSACKTGADLGQEFTFIQSCEQIRRGKLDPLSASPLFVKRRRSSTGLMIGLTI
jgi:hypothetical protein